MIGPRKAELRRCEIWSVFREFREIVRVDNVEVQNFEISMHLSVFSCFWWYRRSTFQFSIAISDCTYFFPIGLNYNLLCWVVVSSQRDSSIFWICQFQSFERTVWRDWTLTVISCVFSSQSGSGPMSGIRAHFMLCWPLRSSLSNQFNSNSLWALCFNSNLTARKAYNWCFELPNLAMLYSTTNIWVNYQKAGFTKLVFAPSWLTA